MLKFLSKKYCKLLYFVFIFLMYLRFNLGYNIESFNNKYHINKFAYTDIIYSIE